MFQSCNWLKILITLSLTVVLSVFFCLSSFASGNFITETTRFNFYDIVDTSSPFYNSIYSITEDNGYSLVISGTPISVQPDIRSWIYSFSLAFHSSKTSSISENARE